jgi:hypothetical protein
VGTEGWELGAGRLRISKGLNESKMVGRELVACTEEAGAANAGAVSEGVAGFQCLKPRTKEIEKHQEDTHHSLRWLVDYSNCLVEQVDQC